MKKIIENLANIFGTTAEDVLSKLNLNQNFESKELAKVLGVYSLFDSKEEHANYINSKLSNKEEEIANQKQQLAEFNEKSKASETYKSKLLSLARSEWEKLGIKRSFDKENIDLDLLDFSNLNKSIIDYADKEGFAITKPNYDKFIVEADLKDNDSNEFNNNVSIVNGAVKK